MVRKVLDYCGKFFLSGFTNKSRQFLVELKFDQEIEGLKSLKVKLHKVIKITERGSNKAVRYVLDVDNACFGRNLVVLPNEWLKASRSNFSSGFIVHCGFNVAFATIRKIKDESKILPVAQCA